MENEDGKGMATTLSITAGPLSSTVTAADDAKAQAILTWYARSLGVPDSATNQQKLDAVVEGIRAHIVRESRNGYINSGVEEVRTEAVNNVDW
jgi:hypothetical protein